MHENELSRLTKNANHPWRYMSTSLYEGLPLTTVWIRSRQGHWQAGLAWCKSLYAPFC